VLTNAGLADADVPVAIWEDGAPREAKVRVPAGKAAAVPLLKGAAREAHFVAVRVDPRRELPQADRGDDFAFAHVPGRGHSASKAMAMIAVGNPTPRTLRGAVVRVPVAALWDAEHGGGALISPIGGDHTALPQQMLSSPRGAVVVFRADELPPMASVNFLATPRTGGKPADPEALAVPFDVSNGVLTLRKRLAGGDLIDDVVIGGVSLGRVQALVHQNVGQDLWLPANRLVSVRRVAGPVKTTLEFVAEYRPEAAGEVRTAVDDAGTPAAARGKGAAWRARYRLRIAGGLPAFELTCLSVTNADDRPWRLVSYFHFLPSHIGGSPAGDAASVGEVPSYHGLRTVWFDAKVRAGYGAVVPAPLEGNFWLDPAGGQHPDVRRPIDKLLAPGETWTAPGDEAPAWVFGVRGPPANRPWRDLAEDLQARAKLSVKVWR